MTLGADSRPARDTYRHGDLRRALLAAGIDLARAGGPDAVVLREATRRVGVSPAAAYRHFADRYALLHAVCAAALSMLVLRWRRNWRRQPAQTIPSPMPAPASARSVPATSASRAEPGLFRTAFAVPMEVHSVSGPGSSGLTPFQRLAVALDGLVAAGVMPLVRRPGAEFLAWSAVHGLAMLAIDGPLRGLAEVQTAAIGQRLIDIIERGL